MTSTSRATPVETDECTPLLPLPNNSSDNSHDDLDFDARFNKWKAAVALKFRRSKNKKEKYPQLLVTLFDGVQGSRAVIEAKNAARQRSQGHNEATSMTSSEFQAQVNQVKNAIAHGIYPKMITTGSSGSYFVRIPFDLDSHARQTHTSTIKTNTIAVFKPKDEEPYGNLNPKRKFLRKYLWWAMGRPCLLPNFSYLSEVGASYLDARLVLQMVPRTELVELSSPTFHYAYNDRIAYDEDKKPLPAKIGSYQTFLNGYVMASDFLRRHPWPSRSRSLTLMMRDFEEERQAHKVSRKKEKARLRKCGISLKRFILCRHGVDETVLDDLDTQARSADNQPSHRPDMAIDGTEHEDGFVWTPRKMHNFRLELEKLVVLDFLMRNTDRGLDNFMIRHNSQTDEIKIGAIDNSLSFPIKHPNEIRQYPFGWLFLPTDLIGLPFSKSTRDQFLPILNDPIWWQETIEGLRVIFGKDPLFDADKFDKQISVMKGQGWNLVQCFGNADEGPLDLCAREKKLVHHDIQDVTEEKLDELEGVKIPLGQGGRLRVDLLPPTAEPHSQPQDSSKPVLNRSMSTTHARTPSSNRPIGMRTSLSYRKALMQAAESGADLEEPEADFDTSFAELDEGAHPRSLPEHTAQDPFADFRKQGALDVQEMAKQRRPSGHQRIFSLQEQSSTVSLFSSPQEGPDAILGRMGIEVLEDIDRQRRKENKVRLFGGGRKRLMTSSSFGSAINQPQETESAQERLERLRKDIGGENNKVPQQSDMVSSIVSELGTHRPMRGGGDRMANSGYMRRNGSTSWDDGVLSEEDEERGNGKMAQRPPTVSHRSVGPPGPSIQGVLAQAQESCADKETKTVLVPHIPHANAVTQAPMTEEEATPTPSRKEDERGKKPSKIKVMIERLVTDTRQAWLQWV